MQIKMPRFWLGFLIAMYMNGVKADEVLVAVASNFSAPMKVLQQRFEQSSDHQLKLSFGSSGKLFAQIQHGAPFQVFLSADQVKPEMLIESGYAMAASRFTYAAGTLVLWTSIEGDKPLGVDALRNDLGRLALANPKLAPYGLAARQTLQNLQLEEVTRKHWVMGENISQTFQFVMSGNAQYGFVAFSQIMQPDNKIKGRYWVVPSSLYSPIYQDAVLLKPGQNSQGALDFLTFMQGKDYRAVIASFGYRFEETE